MKRIGYCLVLLAILVCCSPKETAKWIKYENNPVLGNKEIGTCFDVNVIPDGDAVYNMYFSWRPRKSVALSRSDDGINWSDPVIVLREDSTSGWENIINRSTTVFCKGKYHMWYTGQITNQSCIGYAVSDDGINFQRVQKDPVMSPTQDFEGVSIMCPYVMWDEQRDVFRMWYSAGEQYEPNVLCYAESKDGVNWERYDKNPILVRGEGDVWDKDRVGGCEVKQLKDGRYIIFYIGYSDINTARIGAAISPDGISGWKRLKENPLIEPDPECWDGDACYKPSVSYDEENDRWMIWYNGRRGSDEFIGLATHEGYYLGEVEDEK